MRYLVLFLFATNARAEIKFFEVRMSHDPNPGLRLEIQVIGKERVHVASRLLNDRATGQIAVPIAFGEKMIADFEKALPKAKRTRYRGAGGCGQLLVVRIWPVSARSETVEYVCLDLADRATEADFVRWWKSTGRLLRI